MQHFDERVIQISRPIKHVPAMLILLADTPACGRVAVKSLGVSMKLLYVEFG